jgi:hypothetical protein
MGPPPSNKAKAGRSNQEKESVQYLCGSEAGIQLEPIDGPGPLWIQRFSLPTEQLSIADFGTLRNEDFCNLVFWFAEQAGNPGVPISLGFSQFVASLVVQRFDGMRVPGVRGNKDCFYFNVVIFRAESRWIDFLETDSPPFLLTA